MLADGFREARGQRFHRRGRILVLRGRDNDYFGMGPFDDMLVIDGAKITGGGDGVEVIADAVDSTVVLDNVTFSGLSGPEMDSVECCGFTATVVGGP